MKTVDLEASANNLLDLECCPRPPGARDPTAVLELYAPDITYFDPLTPTSIDGDEAMEKYYQPFAGKNSYCEVRDRPSSGCGRSQYGAGHLQLSELLT